MKHTIQTENLPKSQIKITVSVDAADFEAQVKKSKAKVLSEANLPGFRKGHVPEEQFVKAYGALAFRQEAAYEAVDATYVSVLVENKIKAVGKPTLNIVSFNEGENLQYEIVVDVMPTLTLGDYKSVSSSVPVEQVGETTDEEMDKVLEDIVSYRTKKGENGEDIVPELDEEMIKSLGIESGSLDELKQKIRENTKMEKEFRAKDVRKNAIIQKLLDLAIGEVPETFIDNELVKMEDKITSDLAQMGVGFPEYLKHLGKTREEWAVSERANAEKAARLQIILLQISEAENMKPSQEAIAKEVAHMQVHYAGVDLARLRAYCEEVMTNSFVMEYILTGERPNEEELFKVDHDHDHDHGHEHI
jgi:FKBP-type peptidyl-prolyl cis-trans isomerase (trigger factor)